MIIACMKCARPGRDVYLLNYSAHAQIIFMQNMVDSMDMAAAAPKSRNKRARLQHQFWLQSVGRSWPVRIKLDFATKTLHMALIL